MQEEICRRTREAPKVPTGGKIGVRHTAIEARRGNPETGLCWNLSMNVESRIGRRSSTVKGNARRMHLGSLIKHITQSVGKPRTRPGLIIHHPGKGEGLDGST